LSVEALSDGARVWFFDTKWNQVVTAAGMRYYHPAIKQQTKTRLYRFRRAYFSFAILACKQQDAASKRLTERSTPVSKVKSAKDGFDCTLGNG
jgi:hypothetical protein